MNTDNSLHRFRLCLCALVLALAGCNDHELLDAPSPSTEPAGLRFAVTPMGATTRVSYDGVRSMFDEGETIGCIIATRDANAADGTAYDYAANSRWTYRSGYLVLEKVYTNGSWDNNSHTRGENELTNLIAETNPGDDDGFLTIQDESKEYAFYFYYPYIDDTAIYQDAEEAAAQYTADNSTPFYRLISYPNCATTETASTVSTDAIKQWLLMSTVHSSEETWNGTGLYSWKTYPCFANHTQTSKAQMNHSDFLWVSREGITSASSQRVNLVFEKKMATIEVDSDIQLNDIYFAANKANTLLRGNIINLATGTLTAYDDPNPYYETSVQKKNKYFKTDEHIIPCYRNQNIDEGINYYRLVLPYQTTFACNLCFTLEGKSYTIDLSTNIPSLEEDHLYTIHINQAGETTFDIVDWENDRFEILDPDTDLEDVPNP